MDSSRNSRFRGEDHHESEGSPMPKEPDSPIRDIASIDMIGRRKDGGVDLGIIVTQRLERKEEHQQLLMDKVEAYLRAINSDKFRKDYGDPPPSKTIILVKCLIPPDPVIGALVKRMERWAKDNRARIKLQVEKMSS
jgi:hypothetical protein